MIQKTRYAKLIPQLSKGVGAELDGAIKAFSEGKEKEAEARLDDVLKEILKAEKIDRRFVSDIIVKGRTKIGALLYAQGLSLDSAAELTGAPRNEILSYSGKTMMADRFGRTISATERLKHARKILK